MAITVPLKEGKYIYYPDTNEIINREFKDSYSSKISNRKIHFEPVDIDQRTIQNRIRDLKQIIIEITQTCNMRCKYCTYSGEYFFDRSYSDRSLSLHSALKGLDYLYSFIQDRKKKHISLGFYGGEPLLEYENLKKITRHAKSLFKQWKLSLHITTNGTLMNDDILDFFIDNRFNVTVSLDGPEKIHDNKRVFLNGKGTFKVVMKNLEKIKKRDENYYIDHIRFNVVHSNDLSLQKLFIFFKDNELVNRNELRFNRVNSYDTTYYQKYPYDEVEKKRQFSQISEGIYDKLKNQEVLTPVENALFMDVPLLLEKLKARTMTMLAGSCCFDNRIFIDAEGQFHVCEKINDKFSIGDVNSGFDFKRMARIVKDFMELIRKNCLDCSVRLLCQRCYIHFAKDGTLAVDPLFCENSKKIFRCMEELIDLKEQGIV
jgi:uncharacterized protein